MTLLRQPSKVTKQNGICRILETSHEILKILDNLRAGDNQLPVEVKSSEIKNNYHLTEVKSL